MDYKTEQIKKKINELESDIENSDNALLKSTFYDLKNLITSKLDNVKYGLVFEESKENIEIDCETMIPYLEKQIEVNAKSKNGKNFLIEGDNYASLKLLEKTHKEKIDLIYIDPPYNTGAKDWKYNNDYVDSEDTFRHSKWTSMMSKRLRIAKKLLKNEGIIVCSIDHNELFHVGMLMDDIFGEENRIGIVSVVHKPEGRNQEKFFGTSNEFALFYSKNKNLAHFQKVSISEDVSSTFDKIDIDGRRYRNNDFMRKNRGTGGVDTSLRINKPNFRYPIYVSNDLKRLSAEYFEDSIEIYPISNSGVEKARRTLKKEFIERNNKGLMFAERNNNKIYIYEKYYEDEVIKTHWIGKKYNAVVYGTNVLSNLIGQGVFNFPKSLYLMKDIIKIASPKNGLILDFFAGSGTTGHAVIELNKEDGGTRNFILCTNNENNICEEVTFQRLKTVITGKRKDGTVYRNNPRDDNLSYLKVKFLNKESKIDIEQLCNGLIFLESSTENLPTYVFSKEEDFYKFINNKTDFNTCNVYLANDILIPSYNKLKNHRINIREIPDYFYKEEEIINDETI